MINQIYWYQSNSYDPYRNLATEEALLSTIRKGELLVYFWCNNPCVVVGCHQELATECDLEQMKKYKILPARRRSGGGAVFHDRGNLNVSYLCHREDYERKQQITLLLSALTQCGICASVSGRNDLCIDGKKICGYAGYERRNVCCYHACLLLDVNLMRAQMVLTPNETKLRAHRVKSVSARMLNLASVNPAVDQRIISSSILTAVSLQYERPVKYFQEERVSEENIRQIVTTIKSQEYLFCIPVGGKSSDSLEDMP